jgi:hypothetical protein
VGLRAGLNVLEKNYISPLPGIEPQFLVCSGLSLFTAPRELSLLFRNNEEHRRDTTYYNFVIRYNLKKTPGYMFRPSLGHPQANTNIIKNIEVYSIGSHVVILLL